MVGARPRRVLWLGWLALVVVIALFSLYGRPLLSLLRSILPASWVGPALTLLLMAVVSTLVVVAVRRHNPRAMLHLIWLVPLVGQVAVSLTIVAEQLHLLLFGLLGFFAIPLFGTFRSLLACSLIALLDEWLQLWLPSRVGDFSDVLLDIAASLAGLSLALWLAMMRRSDGVSRRRIEVEGDA